MSKFLFFGLGNPGSEYEKSRHSVGRMALDFLFESKKFGEWKLNKKTKSLESVGSLNSKDVLLIKPETFMNKSGQAVTAYGVTAVKKLLVVHDDVDLPLGTIRFSFGRGSGGHRGLDSIIKSLKTKDFIRLRLGISPATPLGKIKKPSSEKVTDFVIADFKKNEEIILEKVFKRTTEALTCLAENGLSKTMNIYNK